MGVLQLWIFSIFFQAYFSRSQNLSCNPTDFNSLRGFLNELSTGVAGWDAVNCCNWTGVTCDSSSGRVIKLELTKQNLMGSLSDSLGNLDQLRTLNLSRNFIHGQIPSSLFIMSNLVVMDLSDNDFSGSIPTIISLPALEIIDVSDNKIIGSIPVGFCTRGTKIQSINLSLNYLIGGIPAGIGNCTELMYLSLGYNLLDGGLPDELFRLTNLTWLTFPENRISGKLGNEIGNLSNLVRLDLSSNLFSGVIPDAFYGMKKLHYFSAQSNQLTGLIPFSLSNSPSLGSLVLRNNSLYGHIDLNCSAMVNLTSLDLATNQFDGSIPSNLPSCPKLMALNLARNRFIGKIPESYRNFPSLSFLSLSNCTGLYNISSALDILQNCPNLTTLVLTLNFRNEELPGNSLAHFGKLRALVIANCGLTGVLPAWLSGLSNLQLLDLSWNRLTGSIPPWFGDFQHMFYLDLSNNSFTGNIPRSLTNLQSLIFRNISLEEPSPDFPFFVRKNTSVRGLQYNQIMSFPPTLELSNNFLTGEIWEEFGNLIKVHVFNLKCNNLSGNIPSSLSGMRSVETLDLSHNNLSGSIPISLVKLTFLSKFSVAYNQLSGIIPETGQFPTFPNSSFEGNQHLCWQRSMPCDGSSSGRGSIVPRNSSRSKGEIIGMAVGVGLSIGIVITLSVLIILRAIKRKEVDHEQDESTYENEDNSDELESKLVMFLFHNKEIDNEFSLGDLLKSTGDFDQANIIGCGGFGMVYKAMLPDGRKVAVKRLSGDCGEMEREFHAEIEALSKAQHPNLVLLQGYCNYRTDKLLIYSFMENGSLDYWLHEKYDGRSVLNWHRRLNIAKGAVNGLAYLHQSCEPHILHRDIKTSNILLDGEFRAHLADFGLARFMQPYNTHVTTDLVGTLGYIPPEYGQASVASYKGDVYSFGVVLLELLTGKRPIDMCKAKGNRDMISWVMQMKSERKEKEVMDLEVYCEEYGGEMISVLDIACCCLNECPKLRPSTLQLVSWLEQI
ncbi:phytosulfokine receptor 1 [Impatiens glandulifera]|uniref:phytosulfokine receptor 1 n=1 Tax=Impatiens glandulifera TaxID=253017 RepID=UPI001FB15FF5|nr:phytosulfokine receptor 1 [Impatiens glandulifera]